jgi:hypothetical protein
MNVRTRATPVGFPPTLRGVPRVVAVDWSGAVGAERRAIWLAEAAGGRLVRLESGRTRAQLGSVLIEEAEADPDLVVGLDFAFSLPAWFLRSRGIPDARTLWTLMAVEAEDWLRDPPPPFWRTRRPAALDLPADWAWRRTELDAEPVAGTRAKSVFQLVGAGQVGTGSLRGMPLLERLARGGFRIWPFDEPGFPLVVEIYPRLLTGAVRKTSRPAREAYLTRFADLDPDLRALAAADDNAFDAAVSALAMAGRDGDWAALPRNPAQRLEGEIWR